MDYDHAFAFGFIKEDAPPEKQLWAAVISRAAWDYAALREDKRDVHYRKVGGAQLTREFRDLEIFFYEDSDEPHSLKWICELIFDDAEQYVHCIRDWVKKLPARRRNYE